MPIVGAAVGAAPLDALVVTLDERRPEERSELIVPPTVSEVPPPSPALCEPLAMPPTSPSADSSPPPASSRRVRGERREARGLLVERVGRHVLHPGRRAEAAQQVVAQRDHRAVRLVVERAVVAVPHANGRAVDVVPRAARADRAHAQSSARQSRDASRAPVTSTCEQTPCPSVQLSPGHGLTGISHTPSVEHHENGGYSSALTIK